MRDKAAGVVRDWIDVFADPHPARLVAHDPASQDSMTKSGLEQRLVGLVDDTRVAVGATSLHRQFSRTDPSDVATLPRGVRFLNVVAVQRGRRCFEQVLMVGK